MYIYLTNCLIETSPLISIVYKLNCFSKEINIGANLVVGWLYVS